MNSLYVKFGMNLYLTSQLIFNYSDIIKYQNIDNTNIIEVVHISNDISIISILNEDNL